MKTFHAVTMLFFCSGAVYGQVGIGTTTPNPNAVLELISPGRNQGLLVPRLTSAQRTAMTLSGNENGMLVYDTDDQRFYYWQGSQWFPIRAGEDIPDGDGTPWSTAGGALTGNYPDPELANNAVTTDKIADGNVTTSDVANRAITDTKLSTTGVAAGTYGSETQIPIITVDAQGRLTDARVVGISTATTKGLGETLAAGPDAKKEAAYNLSSVSIGEWNEKGAGPGALNVNGSHYRNFEPVDADAYTVKDTDYIVIGKGKDKHLTIPLPDATTNYGRILIFRSIATNAGQAMELKCDQLIDGNETSELIYYSAEGGNVAYALTVMSDGKTWWTINRAIVPPTK